MKLSLNRKSISNVIFVMAIVILLYPPSREWFMRQIAFAPSVVDAEDTEKIVSSLEKYYNKLVKNAKLKNYLLTIRHYMRQQGMEKKLLDIVLSEKKQESH